MDEETMNKPPVFVGESSIVTFTEINREQMTWIPEPDQILMTVPAPDRILVIGEVITPVVKEKQEKKEEMP